MAASKRAKTRSSKSRQTFVMDRYHRICRAELGELDDEAYYLLKNGQCLSFALAMAKELGTETVALVERKDSPEDNPWLIHIYAVGRDGSYWDVEGSEDETKEQLQAVESYRLREMSSLAAKRLVKKSMPLQNWRYGRSMVKPVLRWQAETESPVPEWPVASTLRAV